MSRFLTPAKMGLLTLIELYVEGAVPGECSIDVLSFLTSHLVDSELATPAKCPDFNSRWRRAEATVNLVISIKDFERLLNENASAAPSMRGLWYIFLAKLWAVDSLHALHAFFGRLPSLLSKSKEELRRLAEAGEKTPPADEVGLSRSSPFGTFVRRAHLEFGRLRFHDAAELWKDFVKYRQSTAGHWKRRNPAFSRLSFDNVLLLGQQSWRQDHLVDLASVAYGDMLHHNGNSTDGRTLPVSTDDIARLLEFQVEQIQSMFLSTHPSACLFPRCEYGSRLPVEIRLQLQDLLSDSYMVPSLSHYVSFIDAWRAGDYPTSFDYLHRYFDYTIHHRDRLFYQYALMNLAAIQADFGCYREAVAAMLESVSTARENRDMKCLNFALNWLYQFGRSHPRFVAELEAHSMLGGRESLAFLRDKAKETGMYPLWSSAIWSEAKLVLESGESIATCTELMARSSQVLVERNMVGNFPAQSCLHVALWDRLGLSKLSNISSAVFLRSHRANSSFEDELRVVGRLADSMMAQGQWKTAWNLLDSLDENSLRSWRPKNLWTKYRAMGKLKEAVHAGDADGAGEIVCNLLQSKHDDLEPGLQFAIDMLHIKYLIMRKNLPAAFEKVGRLAKEAQDDGRDVVLGTKLLLTKARLLEAAGRPQKGFSAAIKAANAAWGSRLMALLWQGMGTISAILISLGEFEAAAELLTAVLPRALEWEDVELCGWLYMLLADSEVGKASKYPHIAVDRVECFGKAIQALDKAGRHWLAMGNTKQRGEVLAKKATIARFVGNREASDTYAAHYLALRSEAVKVV
ncbi:hypothetical protein MKZ38_010024 [Zalerion maritima]|uniref:Anaphase-promoting complex subunit 5 n=1 Tax=Zalerion maritima TaxID=339359 RepID=A0AAD5RSW8_9PEZI|nr:hypothetical protein MKZ38_010024 [Zalerion maritima]